MQNNKSDLQFEITNSVNKWHEEIVLELEENYSIQLNSFLQNQPTKNAIDQINCQLQEKIGLTLHTIHPLLLTKENLLLSHNNDFSQLLLSTFFLSKLSKFLRAEITFEEKILFFKYEFQSYIKRHYLLGKLDWEISVFLYTYVNGFESLKKHLTSEKWNYFIRELNLYNNGTYGIQNRPWSVTFKSTFRSFDNEEKDVWLAGFKDISNPSMNFYYSPLSFLKFDSLDITDFIIDKNLLSNYLDTYNDAENGIRKLKGLPMVGEGWISETKIFYLIKQHFGNQTAVLHHGRPKWLGRQHFDIYLPEYNLAIEFQGEQHYQPIDFFGGTESFEKNQKRDEQKKILAKENNCHLICIDKSYLETDLLQEIYLRLRTNFS